MEENIKNATPEEVDGLDTNYNIEEELRLHIETQKKHEEIIKKFDVLAGIFVIAFALIFIIGGLKMPVESLTGDPTKWYLSPGLMPVFCGVVLVILSVLMMSRAIRNGAKVTAEDRRKAAKYLRGNKFFRLILAGAFLAIYLFVMLRRIDYFVATFIYLITNMIVFTGKERKIKNLISYSLISLIAAGVITFGFGTLAQIPLP